MPLLICGLLIILIQGVFSSRGKPQCLRLFYIVDSVTNMLFTMSMNVILHKAILILLMVIHLMLPLLIDEFIPEVAIIIKLMLLYLFGLQKPKYFIVLDEYVAENPELFHDIPDFAEDFDSPICLVCTIVNASIFTTARSLFPTNMMLLHNYSKYP